MSENVIIFTSVGSVELIRENLDVDFVAAVARSCKKVNPPKKTAAENDKFVANLFKLKHLSVFEFADAVFRVTCPIFVARQLMRYRVASYCEKSLRATSVERKPNLGGDPIVDHYNACVDRYEELLSCGYKREEARRVLPLDTPTTYFFKVNGRELCHIIEERSSATTQAETRETVAAIRDLVKLSAPRFAEAVGL